MFYFLKVMIAVYAIVFTGMQAAVLKTGALNYMDRDHYDPAFLKAPCSREQLSFRVLPLIQKDIPSCVCCLPQNNSISSNSFSSTIKHLLKYQVCRIAGQTGLNSIKYQTQNQNY
jgi:hypothetical protein